VKLVADVVDENKQSEFTTTSLLTFFVLQQETLFWDTLVQAIAKELEDYRTTSTD